MSEYVDMDDFWDYQIGLRSKMRVTHKGEISLVSYKNRMHYRIEYSDGGVVWWRANDNGLTWNYVPSCEIQHLEKEFTKLLPPSS